MSTPTITINMDKHCAECGKKGAAESGICLTCSANAMSSSKPMKSHAGRLVQQRWRELLPKRKAP